ncbi:hypothetical protein ABPG73_007546 [Tetrahymena malaccensis]
MIQQNQRENAINLHEFQMAQQEFEIDVDDYNQISSENQKDSDSCYQKIQLLKLQLQDTLNQVPNLKLCIIFQFNNPIKQEALIEISRLIESLSQLKYLSLKFINSIVDNTTIQILFKQLSKLQFLHDLSLEVRKSRYFGINSFLCLAQSLSQMQNLCNLSIAIEETNYEFNNEIISLLSCLPDLAQLKDLKLYLNVFNFTSNTSKWIGSFIQNLQNLNSLTLVFDNLYADEIENTFAESLIYLKSLQKLQFKTLGFFKIKKSVVCKFIESISSLQLQELIIEGIISQDDIENQIKFASALKTQSQIKKLRLESYASEIQESLSNNLRSLKDLEDLQIEIKGSCCQTFDTFGFIYLFESVQSLNESIKSFSLKLDFDSQNYEFTIDAQQKLVETLKALNNLNEIALDLQAINFEISIQIIDIIQRVKSIENISIKLKNKMRTITNNQIQILEEENWCLSKKLFQLQQIKSLDLTFVLSSQTDFQILSVNLKHLSLNLINFSYYHDKGQKIKQSFQSLQELKQLESLIIKNYSLNSPQIPPLENLQTIEILNIRIYNDQDFNYYLNIMLQYDNLKQLKLQFNDPQLNLSENQLIQLKQLKYLREVIVNEDLFFRKTKQQSQFTKYQDKFDFSTVICHQLNSLQIKNQTINLEEEKNQYIDDNSIQSVLKTLNQLKEIQPSSLNCKENIDFQINISEHFQNHYLKLNLNQIDLLQQTNFQNDLGNFKNIQAMYLYCYSQVNSQFESNVLNSIQKLERLQNLTLYLQKNYKISTEKPVVKFVRGSMRKISKYKDFFYGPMDDLNSHKVLSSTINSTYLQKPNFLFQLSQVSDNFLNSISSFTLQAKFNYEIKIQSEYKFNTVWQNEEYKNPNAISLGYLKQIASIVQFYKKSKIINIKLRIRFLTYLNDIDQKSREQLSVNKFQNKFDLNCYLRIYPSLDLDNFSTQFQEAFNSIGSVSQITIKYYFDSNYSLSFFEVLKNIQTIEKLNIMFNLYSRQLEYNKYKKIIKGLFNLKRVIFLTFSIEQDPFLIQGFKLKQQLKKIPHLIKLTFNNTEYEEPIDCGDLIYFSSASSF